MEFGSVCNCKSGKKKLWMTISLEYNSVIRLRFTSMDFMLMFKGLESVSLRGEGVKIA